MTKENFPALTGLRAIAAFMVFFHHCNPMKSSNHENVLYNFFNEFHVGVTIFFVLSGFLIAYRYYDDDAINLKKYFINRFARIYPVYFILTTLTFIVTYLRVQNGGFDWVNYVLNITFFRGFFDDIKFSGIGQGWSLTVEEVFYILAPFFFFLIRRNIYFLVILPCITIISGFLIVYFLGDFFAFGFFKSNMFMLGYTFFGRCFEFFIGIGIFLIMKKYYLFFKFNYFSYLGFFSIIIWIITLSVLNFNGLDTNQVFSKLINNFFLPLFGISFIIFGLVKERNFVTKLLSSNIFQILGKSSFVFYLIHVGIFKYKIDKITANYTVKFFLITILSIVIYFTLEKPLNKYIRRKFS